LQGRGELELTNTANPENSLSPLLVSHTRIVSYRDSIMFTGLDVVVVFLVLLGFIYTIAPQGDQEIKIDPFTMVVMLIVLGAIVVSMM
jgi:hypothetical protein